MFTVHRASTSVDWHQATTLLQDYVECVRGWTDMDPFAEQPKLHAELAGVADHYATDARGRGVADRLVDAAVGEATERHCRVAWLETVRGAMDPAISVYRRNGFAESSTRRPMLSLEGAIVMERILSVASRCA